MLPLSSRLLYIPFQSPTLLTFAVNNLSDLADTGKWEWREI
jgi:hypothetical protein